MIAALADRLVPPRLRGWHRARSRGERRIIAVAAIVAVAALAWVTLWQPLTTRIALLRSEAPQRDAQLAEGRRVADEIAGLARATRPPPAAGNAETERALGTALTGIGASWETRGDTVRVTAAGVSFASLVAALETLQASARLQPLEATLTARIEPGTVRAEITLGRSAAPRGN